MCYMSHVMCHVSHVTCHVSCVMCRMLRVTCHLSLTPTAIATATDPTPAISPLMHSRLVFKDPKTQKKSKRKQSLKRQEHKHF